MKQRPLPMFGALLLGAWVAPSLAAVAQAPVPGAAQRAPVTAYRGFNFAYQTEGSRAAAPTQVFDDGRRTYLQFNALDQVPEIWTDDGRARSAPRRLQTHLESPYVVIEQVLPRMRLVLNGQDTLLRNEAWQKARVRAPGNPAIWTDRLPFGPEDLPAAQAPRQAAQTAPAAPTGHAGMPANPGAGTDGEGATMVDLASLDWPTVPPGERMLDAHLEALRRQAADLLQRAEQAQRHDLAQALRTSLASLTEAQQRHLLQAQRAPATPAPAPRAPAHQMLALADTRTRSDLMPAESGPGDLPPPDRAGAPAHPAGAALAAAETAAAAATSGRGNPLLVLEVRDNQRLSQALAQFLETQGWRLEWESASDFVVRRGYIVRGTSLRDVLLEALGEYRLSAVLYGGNLVVAVSGGDH